MTGRRRFIVRAGGMLAAAGAAATVDGPSVIAQPRIRWRMPATVPAALDVPFGAIQRFTAVVDELSGGRFQIEVFPAGQIMPPLACFDETSKGTVEAFRGTSYNWAQKEPAVQWFATVPFGMNPAGMAAWLAAAALILLHRYGRRGHHPPTPRMHRVRPSLHDLRGNRAP